MQNSTISNIPLISSMLFLDVTNPGFIRYLGRSNSLEYSNKRVNNNVVPQVVINRSYLEVSAPSKSSLVRPELVRLYDQFECWSVNQLELIVPVLVVF